MILWSNIGANVQDAKRQVFSGCVTTFHISRRHMLSVGPVAPYFAVRGAGGEGICVIDMFWAPHSALYIL
jgi:hypothetical protein